MSFFDFKDFLTLQEVGEYLFEKKYPKFDRDRLIVFVKDLINERKLSVAIYYKGDVGTKLSFRDKDKTDDPDRTCYINTYAWIDFNIAHALFKNSSTIKYGISKKDIGDYRFDITPNIKDYKSILDHENEAYHCYIFIENDDYKLTLDDVRYYRTDLDRLFNEKNSELESIKDELADVKARNAKLIADKERSKATGSFMLGTPKVEHGELKTNDQLTEAWTAANVQIADLTNQLAQANAALADKPADDNTEQDHLYNWQAMDKNQYPPELHLAIEIWKEYYHPDAIKHISQFDAGRFNRIANDFNLSQGNLKSRIRSLLTPLNSKTKSPELLSSLEVINIIHNDKLEQD